MVVLDPSSSFLVLSMRCYYYPCYYYPLLLLLTLTSPNARVQKCTCLFISLSSLRSAATFPPWLRSHAWSSSVLLLAMGRPGSRGGGRGFRMGPPTRLPPGAANLACLSMLVFLSTCTACVCTCEFNEELLHMWVYRRACFCTFEFFFAVCTFIACLSHVHILQFP